MCFIMVEDGMKFKVKGDLIRDVNVKNGDKDICKFRLFGDLRGKNSDRRYDVIILKIYLLKCFLFFRIFSFIYMLGSMEGIKQEMEMFLKCRLGKITEDLEQWLSEFCILFYRKWEIRKDFYNKLLCDRCYISYWYKAMLDF